MTKISADDSKLYPVQNPNALKTPTTPPIMPYREPMVSEQSKKKKFMKALHDFEAETADDLPSA
jgi:hypothetical protein